MKISFSRFRDFPVMHCAARGRRVILGGVLSLIALGAAHAQQTLYMSQGSVAYPVYSVSKTVPQLFINGQLESISDANGSTLLKPGGVYAPVIVAVDNVGTSFANTRSDSVNRLLKSFSLRATFAATAPIDGAFLFLMVKTKSGLAQTFFHEIPSLKPNKSVVLAVEHKLAQNFVYGGYEMHVFAAGAELLDSTMGPARIEAALEKMIAAQVEGVTAADPKPLIAPPPAYPEKLRSKNLKGHATLAFAITTEGKVGEVTTVEADDPAFAEAAMAVITRWRFVPRVRDGARVNSTVRMPFNFVP